MFRAVVIVEDLLERETRVSPVLGIVLHLVFRLVGNAHRSRAILNSVWAVTSLIAIIKTRHRVSDSASVLDFDTPIRDPHWIRGDALLSRWFLDLPITHTEAGTVPRACHDVVF